MSTLRVNTIQEADGTAFSRVLQVVQATKTDTASQSVGSGGHWDLSDPVATITPASSSNKIIISAMVSCSVNADNHGLAMTILKDGSTISNIIGDANGNMGRFSIMNFHHLQWRSSFFHFSYVDTAGGTSAISYKIRLAHDSGATQTIYLNRTVATDNLDDRKRTASNIILTEISA